MRTNLRGDRLLAVLLAICGLGACARDLDVPSGAGYLTGRAVESVPGTTDVRALTGAKVSVPGTNLSATADGQGLFTIGPLPTGQYRLLLTGTSADGKLRQRLVGGQQVLNGATRPLGDLQLEESARLSGRALLEGRSTGNSGVTVYLPGLDLPAASTGDTGAWSLSGLPAGAVRAAAWRAGYQVATTADLILQGGAITSAVDLVLSPEAAQPQPGSISGTVRVMGAADATGVTVSVATSTPADPGNEGAPVKTATTAADGRFKLDGLPPGLYTLRAVLQGLPPARAANLALAAGESLVLPDVVLAPGPTTSPAATPPTVAAPAQVTAAQGVEVAFTVTAAASAGAVTVSFQGAHPATATLTPGSAGAWRFSWVPDAVAAAAGGVDVAFAATAQGLTALASTHLDVYPQPDLQISGPTHLSGGQAFDLALSASSRYPAAAWTLSATGTRAGAAFNDLGGGRGSFHWATSLSTAGSFAVTFTAGDGLSQTQRTVALVVDKFNVAPVLAGPLPPRAVNVGGTTSAELSATDANLDALTIALSPAGHAGVAFTDHGDGTASFSYSPPMADAGTVQYFTFTASDGALTSQQGLQITVPPLGTLPTLSAPVRLAATAGVPLAFTVTATVPGAVPAISVQGALPAGASLTDHNDGTASFAWTPDAAAAGLGGASVTFAATAAGATATATTRIDVYPALNQPPALQVTGPSAVDEGATLTLTLTATDPQGSPLTLLVSGAPPNAQLKDDGGGSGTFTFSPRIGQAGLYPVSFIASNGRSVTTRPLVITVNAVTGYVAPQLLVVGNTHLSGGQSLDLVVAATDLDATKKLLLSASGTPAGSVFTDLGGGSGSFHWLPGLTRWGTFPIVFSVNDGVTTVSQTVSLVVDKFNVPPVLAGPLTDRVVSVGGTLTVQLTAADPNLDPLTFSMTPAGHPGAALTDNQNGTATFTFSPLAGDASSALQFIFFVSDGALGAQQTLNVTVPAPGNQAPVWDPVASGLTVAEASTLTINLRATDANSDPITLGPTLLPAYCSFKDNGDGTGVLVVSPGYGVVAATGPVSIGLLATDNHGGATPLTLSVTVTYVPRPPVITHHADVVLGETASVPVAIAATEPDGKALTYAFTINPAGLGVSQGSGAGANTYTVTAPPGTAGSYTIGVKVSNASLSSTDTVSLTVVPRPTLTVTTSGNGTLTSSPAGISCASNAGACSALFNYGASVTLSESPGSGAQFGGWSGACSGLAATCPLTLTTSTSAGAAFGTYYTFGVTATGPGTVSADSGLISACGPSSGVCSGTYPTGLSVLLTATPAAGDSVSGWGGACAGATGNTCTVAMSAARLATVAFAPVTVFSLVSGDLQTARTGEPLAQSVVFALTTSATTTGGSAPPITGLPVTLTGPPGAVVTPPVVNTDAGGHAAFAVRLGPVPGTQQFVASTPTAALSLAVTATATTPAAGLISTVIDTDHVSAFSGIPGPALAAHVNGPTGLALSKDGTLYLGDFNNNRIEALSPAGVLTLVAGTGACAHTGDFGPAAAATLCNPYDIALDETNGRKTLFVVEGALVRAIDLTASPPTITTFAGGGTAGAATNYGDKGTATQATLVSPQHIAVDPAGAYLYIVDNAISRYRRVTLGAVNIIDTWLTAPANTSCTNGYTSNCAASYTYNDCTIAFGPQGIYLGLNVGNFASNCTALNRGSIYRASADGSTLTLVAGGGTNTGEGIPAVGSFFDPRLTSMTIDQAGNLYFADRYNNRIRKIEAGVGRMTTVAGTGVAGYAGDFVDARAAQLNSPWAVLATPGRSLIVSDTNNSAVRTLWSAASSTPSFASLAVTAGSPQSVVVDQVSAPLSVRLLDPAGAPLTGYTINWSVVDPGGFLLQTASQTDQTGTATTFARPGLLANAPYRFAASFLGAATPLPSSPATLTVNTALPASGSTLSIVDVDHTAGGDGFNAAAATAHVNLPHGVVAAKDGTVYFVTWNNNQVFAVSPAGVLSVVAGTGACTHTGDGGPASAATLCNAIDLALDESGQRKTLYVLDGPLVRAIDLTAAPPVITTFAGGGTVTLANQGDGLSALLATLTSAAHIAVPPAGDYLYVVDNGVNRIRRVSIGGGNIINTWFTVPPNTSCNSGYPNSCAISYSANDCSIAFDQQGALVGMAVGNFNASLCGPPANHGGVYRVPADGSTYTVVAGGGAATGEGIAAVGAQIDARLTKILVDPATGSLYLVERYNHRVRKVSNLGAADSTISTLIGTGTAGNGSDGLNALSTALNTPWGVAVAPDGKVIVSDTNNNTLRAVWP